MAEIAIPFVAVGVSLALRQLFVEARESREAHSSAQRHREERERWERAGERSRTEGRGISDHTRRSFGRLSIMAHPDLQAGSIHSSSSSSSSIAEGELKHVDRDPLVIPPMPRTVTLASSIDMSTREKKVRLVDRMPNAFRRGTAPVFATMTEDDLLEEKCPICLCLLGSPCDGGRDEQDADHRDHFDVLLLPCGHAMHENCIEDWLSSHIQCPVCKQDLEKLMQDREEEVRRAEDRQRTDAASSTGTQRESVSSRIMRRLRRLRSLQDTRQREETSNSAQPRRQRRHLFRRRTL